MNKHGDFTNDTQFWQEHRQQLYYFVLKRVSDPSVAEDIVQMALVKVYSHLNMLSYKDKFLPWLYQITRNTIIDYYRAERPEEALTVAAALTEIEDTPSVYEQLVPCILPLVDKLASPYREAVRWSEIEGLTQKEVAVRMNISLPGAKSQVQRGRKQLKALLQACCQIELDSSGKLLDYESRSECRNCGSAHSGEKLL